jgi:hypothetical protein
MLSSIVHGLITAFISYRNGKKSKSRNFSQNLMGKLWIAILIIMPIFFLQQSFLDQFNLNLLLSNICLILALSTWVHAWLIDLKWILWVPIGWLLCSVGIFFIPEFYSPILVALATFGFDFIPGIILKRSKEK